MCLGERCESRFRRRAMRGEAARLVERRAVALSVRAGATEAEWQWPRNRRGNGDCTFSTLPLLKYGVRSAECGVKATQSRKRREGARAEDLFNASSGVE